MLERSITMDITQKAIEAKTAKILVADQMRGKAATLPGTWVYSLRALTRLAAKADMPAALSGVGVLVETDPEGKPLPDGRTIHPDLWLRQDSRDPVEKLAYEKLFPHAAAPRIDQSKPAPTPGIDIWFRSGVVLMPRKTQEGNVLLLAHDPEVLRGTVLEGKKIEAPKSSWPQNNEARLAAVAHWNM